MNAPLSRRDFLQGVGAAALAAAGGTALAAGTPIPRVGSPRLKVSLNAYSFGKLLNDFALGRGAGMSLFALAEYCAKHDFDGFDPTGYYFPGYRERKLPDDNLVLELKRRAFELGLASSASIRRGAGRSSTPATSARRTRMPRWNRRRPTR